MSDDQTGTVHVIVETYDTGAVVRAVFATEADVQAYMDRNYGYPSSNCKVTTYGVPFYGGRPEPVARAHDDILRDEWINAAEMWGGRFP